MVTTGRATEVPRAAAPGDARPASVRRRRRGGRTQEERSAEAQAALVEVAIRKICAKGLAYVTMAEIADEAGMTRGAIQHHFGDRDGYIRAVLARLTERLVARIEALAPSRARTLETRVRGCVRDLSTHILSPELLAIVDISISSRSEPALFAATQATARRLMQASRVVWRCRLEGYAGEKAIARAFQLFTLYISGWLVTNYGRLDPEEGRVALRLCEDVTIDLLGKSAAPARERPRAD